MSRMLRRPPAKLVNLGSQQGPLVGRQHYGAVDTTKNFGGSSTTQRAIQYVWQLFQQVNPAHEQPKLIYYSGAQPFTVGMQLRRFSRTFMSASPRFEGRWAYVGLLERQYTERSRMRGQPSRQGTTYAYPRFTVAPRAIQLGGGGPPGPPYSPRVFPQGIK